MRQAWLILAAILSTAWVIAQNRPQIQWHVDADQGIHSISYTEDRSYLLRFGGSYSGVLKLYRVDWLLQPNRPLGTALVSYWLGWSYVRFSLTDRCDNSSGQEYIWAFGGTEIHALRLMRSSSTYGGAYLDRTYRSSSVAARITSYLVLRGNMNNRAYNRLAAIGLANGDLLLVSVREPSNPSAPPLIQQEVLITGAHSGGVTAIAYEPTGRYLVTGGADGLVRVWTIMGNLGSLSLQPGVSFVNGWGIVTGLNFAQNKSLLITANDNWVVSAYLWNNGSPSSMPIWQTYIDRFVDYSYYRGEQRYLTVSTPEPSSGLIPIHHSAYDSYEGLVNVVYLLNPSTGGVEYRCRSAIGQDVIFGSVEPLFFTTSGNAHYYFDGFMMHPFSITPQNQISLHNAAATAVCEVNGNLAVGYADGLVRVYQRSGSGWTLIGSNSTEHQGARIVGLFWRRTSNLISVDSQGRLRVWSADLRSLTAQLNLDYEIESADFYPDYDVIAVIGQTVGQNSGVPKASLVQFPDQLLSDFTPPGNAPSVGIRFVPSDGSIITLTSTTLARWNNNYQQPAVMWQGYAPRATCLSVSNKIVFLVSNHELHRYSVNNGQWMGGSAYPDHALSRVLLWLDELGAYDYEDIVRGLSHNRPGGSHYHRIVRELEPVFAGNCLYSLFEAMLPDEPLAVARDSAVPNRFYVACADGSVVQAELPAFNPVRFGYSLLTPVGEFANRQIFSTPVTSFPFSNICDHAMSVGVFSPADGHLITQSSPEVYSQTPYLRLSPARGVIYSQTGANLSARSSSPPFGLFSSASIGSLRAFAPVSENRVATLVPYQASSSQQGILYGWRLELRDKSDLSVVIASRNLVDSSGAPLHSRWNDPTIEPWAIQMLATNSNATRIAVLGYRADPNNPSGSSERWISVWSRPSSADNDWNWSLVRAMRPNQDWSNATPGSVHFHPTIPTILYVGMNNGELWRYDLDDYQPNPSNPRQALGVTIYTPQLGNPGSVNTVATGELTASNGQTYTILAFGGGSALSVWATSACNRTIIREVGFYNIDAQFSWLRLEQQPNNPNIDLVYGTASSMTSASIPEPQISFCEGDVNNDNIIDDTDLLEVLFNFGAENCGCPADINCDGIVDDTDVLIVLFRFGQQC